MVEEEGLKFGKQFIVRQNRDADVSSLAAFCAVKAAVKREQ